MYGMLLKKGPRFRVQSANSINAVLFELSYGVFQGEDVIFKQDAPEDRTFFTSHGSTSAGRTDCFQWGAL